MPVLTRSLLRASWRSWITNDGVRAGPYWLQLVWTFLFCMAIAFGFTVLGFMFNARGSAWLQPGTWLRWYGANLVVTLVIGYLIHAAFELAVALLGGARLKTLSGAARVLFYAGIPTVCTMVGWPIGVALLEYGGAVRVGQIGMGVIFGMLITSVVISLVIYQFFEVKAREINAEKRATEARLQLLQAQIEPHFLFNTLATVVSLIDHDAPRAKLMLETFVDYLRASLGELRRGQTTVGDELDMAETYLKLLQLRMDDRLAYRIEADAAARAAQVPPLLLQPLVENAITHGLEPKLEGGTVVLRARVDGERLRLEVEDDGLGLDAPVRRAPGGSHGLALENIRQRLASRHGDAARLELARRHPGTLATLELPLAAA
jgi:signal transduction histidine kinase